jgi:hypothetical protein
MATSTKCGLAGVTPPSNEFASRIRPVGRADHSFGTYRRQAAQTIRLAEVEPVEQRNPENGSNEWRSFSLSVQ